MTLKDHNEGTSITTTKVICKLCTEMKNGVADLVKFKSGAVMTAGHPVLTTEGWKMAGDVYGEQKMFCNVVVSLVLENNHVVFINNIPSICLGHNFKTGILEHDYLGTENVIDDLKRMPGWEKGEIRTKDDNLKRDRRGWIEKISYIPINKDEKRKIPTALSHFPALSSNYFGESGFPKMENMTSKG